MKRAHWAQLAAPLLFVFLLMLAQVSAFAQVAAVPPLMSFQARLTKPDGSAVPDGTYSVRFSLWTAATGGTEKWNQTQNVVTKGGNFATVLSGFTTATFNTNLFLEIKLGTDPPLTPRQQLLTVAYAFKADSVKDGGISANSLANNAVTSAKIASNAVTTAKIADGAVTSAKLDASLLSSLSGFIVDNTHPALVGSATTGTFPSRVAVAGNFAYVVNGTSNNLQIFDVTNPTAPVLKGSAATGTYPLGVAVSGNFAYVVNDSSYTLQIFDVSNPATPLLKSTTPTGTSPDGVAAVGNLVYVVNFDSKTMQIFDATNPVTPVLRSTTPTTNNPSAIAVSGNFAYVTNSTVGTLQIFDISNPVAPVLKSNTSTGSFPFSLAVSGSTVYVANFSSRTLQVFDVSNPLAPVLKGSVGTILTPESVAVSGNRVYVVGNVGGNLYNLLLLFDVSDPTAPTLLNAANTGDYPLSVVVSGAYIYVTAYRSNSLEVFSSNALATVNNLYVGGGGIFRSSLSLDQGDMNDGSLSSGVIFGLHSGEGIASKRTAGGNQYGLDFFTSFISRMSITNTGSVGIGMNNPAYKLDVNGDINAHGSVRANGVALSSDARYKQHIATIENPLDTILNLRGVTYDWNRDAWKEKNFPDGRQIGFIAQEAEKVLPELVSTDASGYKSVAYVNVVPVLVEALKAEHTRVTALEAQVREIEMLKAQLAALTARLMRSEAEKATQK